MLKTIAPSEMKRVEQAVMAHTSITGEMLMQRAAEHVADAVWGFVQNHSGMVVCLCGCGNNGGDGLAAMRILCEREPDFCGLCLVLPGELSPDAQREREKLQKTAGSRVSIRLFSEEEIRPLAVRPACVIDALFGTGLSRGLSGGALKACEWMNRLAEAGVPVVAVDIPSGLNGLTGEVGTEAVRASQTITFHRPKPGLYLGNGPEYAGKIIAADIGLNVPHARSFDDAEGMAVLEESDLAVLVPKRKRVTHKGSYGRVLLWAGSRGMAGAAAISAEAALRCGAGLVTVACPEVVVDIVQVLCPCATCLPLPSDTGEAWSLLHAALERADALGVGCGLGQSTWTAELLNSVLHFLEDHPIPCVLDADALNLLSKRPVRLSKAILTPHPAEAGRLLAQSTAEVTADAPAAARELMRRYGASIVLKGACSVLCASEGMGINPFGSPGMAKGGSGDALTGVMAALLAGRAAGAYEMTDLQLMQAACALHGLAGEKAAEQFGERGMLATDLCSLLGTVGGAAKAEPVEKKLFPKRELTIIVEHPAGSQDPETRITYPLNMGYIQQVLEEENRWQDACVLGVSQRLEWFEGKLCAKIHLENQTIWALAEENASFTEEQIRASVGFVGETTWIEMISGK